jgi:hypothetical protein
MDKLRISPTHTGHYASMFRSGLFLGLAVPAVASGLYEGSISLLGSRADSDVVCPLALQQEAHIIPGSATLLFIYAVFAVPVLFSVLVGLNLLAWTRSRINYVFIFGLSCPYGSYEKRIHGLGFRIGRSDTNRRPGVL